MWKQVVLGLTTILGGMAHLSYSLNSFKGVIYRGICTFGVWGFGIRVSGLGSKLQKGRIFRGISQGLSRGIIGAETSLLNLIVEGLPGVSTPTVLTDTPEHVHQLNALAPSSTWTSPDTFLNSFRWRVHIVHVYKMRTKYITRSTKTLRIISTQLVTIDKSSSEDYEVTLGQKTTWKETDNKRTGHEPHAKITDMAWVLPPPQ